ncbi:hypothetical protein ABZP36_026335 [Zizania latifolia]
MLRTKSVIGEADAAHELHLSLWSHPGSLLVQTHSPLFFVSYIGRCSVFRSRSVLPVSEAEMLQYAARRVQWVVATETAVDEAVLAQIGLDRSSMNRSENCALSSSEDDL